MMVPPLFILGATAVGKSEVALALAEKTGAAILVMDAMQVYRGLTIGVGKPTAAELHLVPHGGLDLVNWTETFDVARYVRVAKEFLETSARPVIVCGGTGLYFQALTQGLCEVPAASGELRKELSVLPLRELQERLRRVDPEICFHLDLQNPRRVQRAIECAETTGRSLLAWQRETPAPVISNFQAFWLQRPREEMRARIIQRVNRMLDSGWLEEVERLLREGGEEKLQSCPAIGYRELMQVSLNQLTMEEARPRLQTQTMQYAKRQVTWLNRAEKVISYPVGGDGNQTSQDLQRHWPGR